MESQPVISQTLWLWGEATGRENMEALLPVLICLFLLLVVWYVCS